MRANLITFDYPIKKKSEVISKAIKGFGLLTALDYFTKHSNAGWTQVLFRKREQLTRELTHSTTLQGNYCKQINKHTNKRGKQDTRRCSTSSKTLQTIREATSSSTRCTEARSEMLWENGEMLDVRLCQNTWYASNRLRQCILQDTGSIRKHLV